MYVDFTDFNKACPKDNFPLPRIDSLVDSTLGHTLLNLWMLSLGTTKFGWRKKTRKNVIRDRQRDILLQGHAVWVEECRGHLSEIGRPGVRSVNREECESLRG